MNRGAILSLSLLLVVPFLFAADRPAMPSPTVAGKFEGTWFYVDPGFQIAIFISRGKGGPLRMTYQVRHKFGSEYRTDAGGYAKYIDEGNLVEVLFTGGETSKERIIGHHERTTQTKAGTLVESSDFQIFRTEMGKKLIVHYDDWKTELTDESEKTKELESKRDFYRIFRKASDIVIDFDEIPW